MKKKYLLAVAGLMLSNTALATTFEAKCLNQKSKFSDCKVSVDTSTLTVEYKSKKEKEFNVTIPGEKIVAINSGKYSKRNVAAGLLVSPVFFLTKRTKEQVSIEYTTENNKITSISFQVKEKYGLALKSQLQALSGKVMQEEDKKSINVDL